MVTSLPVAAESWWSSLLQGLCGLQLSQGGNKSPVQRLWHPPCGAGLAGEAAQASDSERPAWHQVLRALREARGVTQDGWAAWLGVGRRSTFTNENGFGVTSSLG